MTLEKLYSVPEVAKLLSVTRQSIYNYIKRGYLHPVRIGPRLKFHESEIREIIENGINPPPGPAAAADAEAASAKESDC